MQYSLLESCPRQPLRVSSTQIVNLNPKLRTPTHCWDHMGIRCDAADTECVLMGDWTENLAVTVLYMRSLLQCGLRCDSLLTFGISTTYGCQLSPSRHHDMFFEDCSVPSLDLIERCAPFLNIRWPSNCSILSILFLSVLFSASFKKWDRHRMF